MSSKALLILIIAVLSIFVLVVLSLIIKKSSSKNTTKSKQKTINDYVRIVSSPNTSTKELEKTIDIVLNLYPFPKKTSYKAPPESKPYLDFIFFIAHHKNANAKMIADLNRNLKKINPNYKEEIDAYEEEGLSKRKFNK